MSKLTRALEELAKRADAGDEAAGKYRDLLTNRLSSIGKKAGVAGAVGLAGATMAPEEAQAGLFNTGMRMARSDVDTVTRTLGQERGSNRGQRKVATSARLSAQEKAAIKDSLDHDAELDRRDDLQDRAAAYLKLLEAGGMSKTQARKDSAYTALTSEAKSITQRLDAQEAAALSVAREWKMRHPSDDWFVPEITGVDVGSKGEFSVKTRNQQYQYNIDPKTQKQAVRGSAHYNNIVDNLVNEIATLAKRAEAGDVDAQRVMDNAGWYKNVESRLKTEYGSFSGMMSDILGATSPNTPVSTNFKFSQDILARATRGEFDEVMNGFADALDKRYALQDEAAAYLKAEQAAGRTKKAVKTDAAYVAMEDEAKAISKRLQAEENTIKQSTFDPKTGKPKNYGINSYNSMIALADRWRVLRKGGAPKARNFSGNLSGRSEQATIDVWAARNLRRHAGLKPIPSSAEGAVTGNIVDAENFKNSLEFGFGQDVLADATARLNSDLGLGLDPRDLQALQWFAEKDYWTKRGWTSAAGEGGSFETMMDNDPVSSMFLGISREQNMEFQGNDFIPTPAQSEATARQIVGAGGEDPDIRAVKGMPTVGMYGDPETAMDIDVISSRDSIPTSILDEAAKQAARDKQDSWFIANRIDPAMGQANPDRFNVGSEVYFRDGVDANSPLLKKIQQDLSDQGVPGYTMIVDPRNYNRVSGVRFLDIPQFYDAESFAKMSPEEYGQHATQTFGAYSEIATNLKAKYPEIQSAAPGYFDVNVKSRKQTAEYVAQLQNPQRDPDALHQEFYGYRPATQRFKEFTGENQPYYSPDGEGVAPTPAGSQQGSATPGTLAATAGLAAGGAVSYPLLTQPADMQGGMGVRMPPAAEDEEAMLAPTGGDLMQQANRDFVSSIRTQPEPDFLTGVQQQLLSGIMKTAGVADLSADVVSAMAGPLLSAPGAIARYAADRYVPGVNYSAEEMAQGRRETEDYFNYQPRTEQGPQYGEQIMQGIGGAIAPYVPAIKKAAGDSYILGAMRQGYDYLGEREKELAKALMDLSPI